MRTFGRLYGLLTVLSVVLTGGYVYARDLSAKYEAHVQMEEGVNALTRQCEALKAERDALYDRVQKLSSDPVEIEASIRRTKHLVRLNERVYRIELPEEQSKAAPQDGVEETTGTRDSSS
mgnify:CR=1 FL=1